MAASDGAIKAESGAVPRQGVSRSDQLAFGNGCAGSVQISLAGACPSGPEVKGRSALTKKVSKLTNVSANNGAAVVAVFTASLRSLLIAFV
jgi:hypothetical protein